MEEKGKREEVRVKKTASKREEEGEGEKKGKRWRPECSSVNVIFAITRRRP